MIEVVLIIVLVGLAAWFATSRTPKAKGKRGERRVNASLSRSLDDADYRVISDVTLPTFNGTTQIDHLIISPYGVFVIETKNLSGWIFGREDQQQWTQVLYRRKYRFFNPIKQNRHHIRTVQSLLQLRSDQVLGGVVFTGNCTFKTDVPHNVVLGVRQLKRFVQSKRQRVLPDHEVVRISNEIDSRRLEPGRDTDRTHIRYVEQQARRRSSGCPRCGSSMVERTNRTTGDTFLGCTRYPRCKGTRPMS